MRKSIITFVCLLSIFCSLLFISCSKINNSNRNAVTSNSKTSKTFTLAQLKKYNGQNGNPAYVAVNGIVYDVSNADRWNNGKHEDGITAGKDLTKQIKSSPHGTSVLKNLPVVGKLKK